MRVVLSTSSYQNPLPPPPIVSGGGGGRKILLSLLRAGFPHLQVEKKNIVQSKCFFLLFWCATRVHFNDSCGISIKKKFGKVYLCHRWQPFLRSGRGGGLKKKSLPSFLPHLRSVQEKLEVVVEEEEEERERRKSLTKQYFPPPSLRLKQVRESDVCAKKKVFFLSSHLNSTQEATFSPPSPPSHGPFQTGKELKEAPTFFLCVYVPSFIFFFFFLFLPFGRI